MCPANNQGIDDLRSTYKAFFKLDLTLSSMVRPRVLVKISDNEREITERICTYE